MTDHVAYRCGGDPDSCRASHCAQHHGELFYCVVCHGAEADLPKDCPGVVMTEDQRKRIADGWVNFIDGKWTALGKSDQFGRIYRENRDGTRTYK